MPKTELTGRMPYIGQENGMMPRIFVITPKTTHAWITEQKDGRGSVLIGRLTDDILVNVAELGGEDNLDDVINTVSWINGGKRYVGRFAIQQTIAPTVGSIAREMGWSMHTPQIVYMSPYSLFSSISSRVDYLKGDIKEIEEERHRFPTPEAKEAKYAAEKKEVDKLVAFNARLRSAAEAYADMVLPVDPVYRDVLRGLLRSGHTSTTTIRRSALNHLRQGRVEQAHEALGKLTPANRRK